MQQDFITFDLQQNGDLFNPGYVLVYSVFGETRKHPKTFADKGDALAFKTKIVKDCIIEALQYMYNVRSNKYTLPYLPHDVVMKLPRVQVSIKSAEMLTDIEKRCDYILDRVLPLMDEIKPGKDSRYQRGYLERMDKLKTICEAVMKTANS